MDAAFERNAFRVLSLPADAQAKEVYRQQQRLQNAIELGDDAALSGFADLPRVPLSTEVVLDAVHRVETRRLIEELFWIHQLGGKFDFGSGLVDGRLARLRADAADNTTKGAVAQHNLAVIFTCLGQGLSGSRRFDYWKDAIRHWNATLSNSVFWQFMQDRDEVSIGNGGHRTAEYLQNVVRETIQQAVLKEVWNAIDSRDYRAISSFFEVIREYTLLLDTDSTLNGIASRMTKDASVSVGGIMDRLSTIEKDSDKALARKALMAAEEDLRKIGDDIAPLVQAFGTTAAFGDMYDARAIAFKKLSVMYFNIVEDPAEALRLVTEAQSLACDPKLRNELDDGWKHVRRAQVFSEAIALLEGKNYAAAQEKLAVALTLSTDEQKAEIEDMQEAVHRSSVLHNVDTTQRTPTLYTFNGIGAKFYGERDVDPKTKSYVTVHWFVFLFVPIIPIACYRVCDSGPNLYTIYGRVPLSPFLKKYRWMVLAVIAVLIILSIISNNTSNVDKSSTSYTATPTAPVWTPTAPKTSRYAEKQAIDAERAEIRRVRDSINIKKQQLEADSAALKRMESYMHSVKARYTEETVPEDVRLQYNSTVDEYNSKLLLFKRNVQEYKAEVQRYDDRIAAFNQRIDRYNANR
jgi:hypothetical protein